MAIRDYVMVTSQDCEKKETVTKIRKKSNIHYSVEEMDETAFVIKREAPRSTSFLVVIPTAGQWYIKKDDETINLTAIEYAKFMSNLEEDLYLPDVVWIDGLGKGKVFGEDLLSFLNTEAPYLKYNFLHINNNRTFKNFENLLKSLLSNHEGFVKWLVKYYSQFDTVKNNAKKNVYLKIDVPYIAMEFLLGYFGEDNIKKFIEDSHDRGLEINLSLYHLVELFGIVCDVCTHKKGRDKFQRLYAVHDREEDIFNEIKVGNSHKAFDFSTWEEYLLSYEREGYSRMSDMLSDWDDTLYMQKAVYGKVKDKYPENLASAHNRITLKYNILKRETDAKAFAAMYEKSKALEWMNSEYVIKAPETPDEMIDEAEQQQNCLTSYIQRVTDGETNIVFLRKKKNPDISCVTIQVENNGKIVQVRGKRNRVANSDEITTISKWAKDRNLDFSYGLF